MADPTLHSLVVARLAAQPPGVAGADQLVLSAFEGPDALREAVASSAPEPSARTAPPRRAVRGTYLSRLEVTGFRGIGAPARLEVVPGPGLTLVVGRNGSGKSSLAEALEMLLTGSNRRWLERPRVWSEGWRNLHEGPPAITATFAVDGRSTPLVVSRTWADGAALGDSTLTIDGRRRSLEENGWEAALRSHPPLLSHNELGRILEGRPTELYDALASILGLGEIAAAEALLRSARLDAETSVKRCQKEADDVVGQMSGLDDERAVLMRGALTAKGWNLDTVAAVLAGGSAAVDERTALRTLRELSTLQVVDRERLRDAGGRLRELDDELRRLGGSDAAVARDTAQLLEQALAVHQPQHGQSCPVCGTAGVLTYEWRLGAVERIAALRAEAGSVEEVHRRADALRAEVRRLTLPAPTALDAAAEVSVDASAALAAWSQWSSAPDDDLSALATHLDTVGPRLIAAVAALRAAAGAELERREDRWRPLAQRLAGWLPAARLADAGRQRLSALKAAEAWVREAHEELRRLRFEPIAKAVQENWQELRQTSNVELGELRLEGTSSATTRRLTLDVHIDGEAGSALGVMSQGELNCLALSLFLPRASMPESPFRFLVIDDPVQAMDPVKVEGLAHVLVRVAATRQVVVLTHDDRLPEAIRRLEMDATIVEVNRREQSVVVLHQVFDPVSRHIEDAMAVARSDGLPAEARRVVPGFVRLALEAACAEAVTRRMVRTGAAHDDIAAALAVPTTLRMWLALALFRDAARSGDVRPHLDRHHPGAETVVHLANRGTHEGINGDLVQMVRAAETLARVIRSADDARR